MIVPFLLLFLGLLLIFFEFYLPGGIMGIAGGILILFSIIKFAQNTTHPWAIVGFIVLAAVSLGVMIRWTLWRIQHAKPGRSIYGWGDQEGYHAHKYDPDAIGKTGEVTSDLKPGGHIRVGDISHSAISLGGYLPKGTKVVVVSGEGETLYVRKKKEENL